MHAQALPLQAAEIATADPENIIVVENHSDQVLIRAAYDNFSERKKAFFVHYLAAEGLIPDRYQSAVDKDRPLSGLKWVVDESLLPEPTASRSEAWRQVITVIVCAGALWLALMAYAFLSSPR